MFGYIYLILEVDVNGDERHKIGFTKRNPEIRLKSLQTGNDDTLKLYYERDVKHYSKVEASLKRYFEPYKTRGEWFECPLNFAELDDMVIRTEKMFESLKDNPFI